MNFKKFFHFCFFLFVFVSCGVKSKPTVPRDPSLNNYIQEKLKATNDQAQKVETSSQEINNEEN